MAIVGDNPILTTAEDKLDRTSAAESFARQVLSLDASEGVVVGVLGPWGSGKTSLINLARPAFEKAAVPVLDFNPWMFSGAEQLVESFFIEVSAQLRIRPGLAEIGAAFEDYGEAFSGLGWLPFVGPWVERGRMAFKVVGKMLQRRREGVSGHREKLRQALVRYGKPILVVLDDVDRLSSSEIRDVFKLVRLTASFPNIIYIVAFDRVRVERALDEEQVPGRDYLEKILQIAVDLPSVPPQMLTNRLIEAVGEALSDLATGPFAAQLWPDVLIEVIRPLMRNMRDVRRYAAAIRGSVPAFGADVALVDALALEALRIFLPDTFGLIPQSVDALTQTSVSQWGNRDEAHSKKDIEALLESAGPRHDVVGAAIRRLFPAAERHLGGTHYTSDWKGRWLKERRVAHEDILRLYLERSVGPGLRDFLDAELALARLSDQTALDAHLRSLSVDRRQDVIAALEHFEDEFAPEQVVPTTIVLLNILQTMPKLSRGMFDFGPSLAVGRVVLRLLRALDGPEAVEQAVDEILPQVQSLSSKLELIHTVGYEEGIGHKLVSEQAAKRLERAWRDEVRIAGVEDLTNEWDLLRVLFWAKNGAGEDEEDFTLEDSPVLTRALLVTASTDLTSQAMGSRAVSESPRLAWDTVVKICDGNEDALRQRIEALKAAQPEGTDDLLELADKYLSGWRPPEFGRTDS